MHFFGEEPLRNQDLASYGWGSYRITLSRLSDFQATRFFVEAFAGIGAGVCTCDTPGSFRSMVAMLHELAHYLQDVTTGVGHWDYLTERRFRPHAMLNFLASSWMPNEDAALLDRTRSMLVTLGQESLFNAYEHRRESERKAINSQLGSLPIGEGSSLIELSDWLESFTLRRLLEAEAVASTWHSIDGLNFSEEGQHIARQHRGLYLPTDMSDEYSTTLWRALNLIRETPKDQDAQDDESFQSELNAARNAFQLLTDISLAFPPPSYFNDRPTHRNHFEPGVRFVRTALAYHYCNGDDIRERMSKYSENLYQAIDSLCRTSQYFTYPSVQDVYSEWATYLRTRNDDDPLLDWRRELCEKRANDPNRLSIRRFTTAIFEGIPVMVDRPGTGNGHLYPSGPMAADANHTLYASLLAHSRDRFLLDMHLRPSSTRSCPFAIGGGALCEAERASCYDGVTNITSLPESPDCLIRNSLRDGGFNA